MAKLTGFSPAVRRVIKERAGIEGEFVRDEVTGEWVSLYAAQIHHRLPRGSGGSRRALVNSPANGLVVSPSTHLLIEEQRELAKRNGWLVSKLTSQLPCEVPVLLHHSWVLLDNEGGWTPTEAVA